MVESSKILLVQLLQFALIFGCFVSLSSSCFITNCPPGGKRSNLLDAKTTRHCSICGPAGTGRCFGPNICCGPDFGCVIRPTAMGGDLTSINLYSVCKTEDLHPHPCRLPGKACGGESFDGRCAVNGVCCSTDRCVLDESCDDVTDITSNKDSNDWLRAFIHNRPASYDMQMNAASK